MKIQKQKTVLLRAKISLPKDDFVLNAYLPFFIELTWKVVLLFSFLRYDFTFKTFCDDWFYHLPYRDTI